METVTPLPPLELPFGILENSTWPRAKGETPYLERVLTKLEQFCYYVKEHGAFYIARERSWSKQKVGEQLGVLYAHSKSPYRRTGLAAKDWRISWLVWLWHNGTLPNGEIDHFNQDPLDDRIENLRDVSKSLNQRNKGMLKTNTSGITNVVWDKSRNKWKAVVGIKTRTQKNIGRFNTKEEAEAAIFLYLLDHPELGYTRKHGKKRPD